MQVKKVQVRAAILDAAGQEFLAHGFRGANLRAIAKRAGCSLSNLYNYFENKDDLFSTLLSLRMNEITQALQTAKSFSLPQGEYMYSLETERERHAAVIKYLYAHREELILIFLKSQGSSVESFSEYVIQEYQDMWNRYVDYLKDNFPDKMQNMVSSFFIHNLSSSYLNSVLEFLAHDVPLEDMLVFCDEMTLYSYYGLTGLLES